MLGWSEKTDQIYYYRKYVTEQFSPANHRNNPICSDKSSHNFKFRKFFPNQICPSWSNHIAHHYNTIVCLVLFGPFFYFPHPVLYHYRVFLDTLP